MADKPDAQLQVKFHTKQEQYAVPDDPYAIQSSVEASKLNKLLNGILKENNANHDKVVTFDFLIAGELLVSTLGEHLQEKTLSTEETVDIEYLERFPAPEPQDCLMHDDWVSAVHTGNNWILTGSYDNSVHIWSTKGKHTLAIPGHTAPVKAISWISLDGNQAVFVSGSHDQTAMVWLWDTQRNSVERVVTCRGHEKGIECVAVAADQQHFVTGSWDNTVKLWSANPCEDDEAPARKKSKTELGQSGQGKTREPLKTLSGHREAASGVRWVDHNTLLSSSWDHTLKLWDLELAGLKQEIVGNKAFFSCDWSPTNQSIITSSADKHIRLYDPRSTETIVKMTYTSHAGWVQAVRWSTTHDTLFLSAGYDGQLKLWETRSPRTPLYDLTGHEDKVLCCDWTNPKLLVSGSSDNTLRIFKSKHAIRSKDVV